MKHPHLAPVLSINIYTISIKLEQHLHMKTQKVDCISLSGEQQDLTTPQVHTWSRNPCVSDKNNWLKWAELDQQVKLTSHSVYAACKQQHWEIPCHHTKWCYLQNHKPSHYSSTTLFSFRQTMFFASNIIFWVSCFMVVKSYVREPASDLTQLENKTSGISDKHSN